MQIIDALLPLYLNCTLLRSLQARATSGLSLRLGRLASRPVYIIDALLPLYLNCTLLRSLQARAWGLE